jgi:hypothetical protein
MCRPGCQSPSGISAVTHQQKAHDVPALERIGEEQRLDWTVTRLEVLPHSGGLSTAPAHASDAQDTMRITGLKFV